MAGQLLVDLSWEQLKGLAGNGFWLNQLGSPGLVGWSNLDNRFAELRAELEAKASAVKDAEARAVDATKEKEEFRKALGSLQRQSRPWHLSQRVTVDARKRLENDEAFRNRFELQRPEAAFVLSMDLRRSTDLMLKAKDPQRYATFLLDLVGELQSKIIENLGLYDKFTGDGVLASFPEFYSGKDAGYRAVKTAAECHSVCKRHLLETRESFFSVLKDVGLGIGLDYGLVYLAHFGSDFTVLGTPVVYACRMSGSPGGRTYANHPAYVELARNYGAAIGFRETAINLKHEGPTVAFDTTLEEARANLAEPDWRGA